MAGKKVDGGTIVLKTTDGGTMKVTAAEAKKLQKQIDKLGGSSQATDRRIKGVTQQSSNATKNFSKQAQTMQGGIVAIYATIAAQIFAVSAAYQFLKSSMETRNLMAAQEAFGAVTGTAYRTLTHEIQAATNGMLGFKEAASGAAIGVASGLTASQLGSLGKAATDASLALGRDLTDSFNRLIRGVTKAEPELLDELGIVLRLENATEKYAGTVGKTREQLNAYERTQAVLNDVLDQAETKYGKIQEIMGGDAFKLGQLTKEIDDMVLVFQNWLMNGILPIISFFKDNAAALVAAVGLFIMPIIKSLLPNLTASFDQAAIDMKASWGRMKGSLTEAGDAVADMGSMVSGTQPTGEESTKYLKDKGIKGKGPDDKLSKQQIAAYRRHMKKKQGIYKKMGLWERAEFRMNLNAQEAALKGSTSKRVTIWRFGQKAVQATIKTTTAVYQSSMALIKGATAAAAWAMNKAMMAAGILGIIAMVIQGVMSLVSWFRDLDKTAAKLRKETEDLTEAQGTLNEELAKMVEVRQTTGLLTVSEEIQQAGNALSSTDITKKLRAYNKEISKGMRVGDDYHDTAVEMAKNITDLAPAMGDLKQDGQTLHEVIASGGVITEDYMKKIKAMEGAYQNTATASKRFQQNQESLNKALDKQIGKFTKAPFADLVTAFTASTGDLRREMGMQKIDGEWQQQEGVGLEATMERRKRERSSRAGLLQSEMINAQKSGTGYENAMKAGKKLDMYETGVFGERRLRSETEMLKLLKDQNITAKYAHTQYMKVYHAEKLRVDELEKMGELNEKDAKELKDKKETLRIQDVLEASILSLQAESIRVSDKSLQTQKDLSELKAGDLGHQNKLNILQKEHEALNDKELNQALQTQATQLAQETHEERIKGLLAEKLVPEEEYKDLKGKALVALADENELSTSNLSLSIAAVSNAEIEEQILINQNKLLREKLRIREALAVYDDTKENNKRAEKLLKLEQQLQKARDKNLKATGMTDAGQVGSFGVGGTNALIRASNLGMSQARQATAQSKYDTADAGITALKAGRYEDPDNEGKFLNTLTGTTGESGFYEGAQDTLTAAQKEYNRLLMESKLAQGDITKEVLAQKLLTDEGLKEAEAKKLIDMKQELIYKREMVGTLNPASQAYNAWLVEQKKLGLEYDEESLRLKQEEFIAMEEIKIQTELMSGIRDTLSNAFQSMFQSLIDGTKSFKDSMKDLAKSVLADLAAMFLKAAALQAMLVLFPGMGGGTMGKLLGLGGGDRYGGERTKGYAVGGIADGPESGYMAKLHGREAVVPLGNDRSIPVNLQGAGGGNTVNVSINMDSQGNGAAQTEGAPEMEGLGRAIGGLVQQHLQTEMRPGGLLNQQGSKGRAG